MNPTDLAAFNQAVSFAQAGQKEAAYSQLKALLKTNDNHRDANLLIWFAFTSPNLDEADTAISAAANLEPNNPNVMAAKDWLIREKRKQVQQPAPQPAFAPAMPPQLEKKPTSRINRVTTAPAPPPAPILSPAAMESAPPPSSLQPHPSIMQPTFQPMITQPMQPVAAMAPEPAYRRGPHGEETIAPSGRTAYGFWRYIFVYLAAQFVYGFILGFIWGFTAAVSKMEFPAGTDRYGFVQYITLPDYVGATRNVAGAIAICGIVTITLIAFAAKKYGRAHVNFPLWALALSTPFGLPLWLAERQRLKHDFNF